MVKVTDTTEGGQYEQRDYTSSNFVSFEELNIRKSTTLTTIEETEEFSSTTIEASTSSGSNEDEVCIIH